METERFTVMAIHTNWQHLAEQASKELDPKKLMILVDQLTRTLEQNERAAKGIRGQQPN
jgi:hypothetical protein